MQEALVEELSYRNEELEQAFTRIEEVGVRTHACMWRSVRLCTVRG